MHSLKDNTKYFAFISTGLFFTIHVIILLNQAFSLFFDVFILFFMGWLIYFTLAPVVHFLVKKGVPRILAVVGIFLVLTIILTVVISSILPIIISQINQFIANTPSFLSSAESYLMGLADHWKIKNIASFDSLLTQYSQTFLQFSTGILLNWLSVLSTTFSFSLMVFLTFIIAAMLLIDEQPILNYIKNFFPQDWHDELHALHSKVNKSFGGFLRGQIILASCYGIATWITLLIFQVPYALLAGLLAFLVMLIPFFNGFLAYLPGLLITILTRSDVLLPVLIVLLVCLAIEFNVLANIIMGDAMGVHPLVIIFALMLGGKLAGVFGVVFSIPIAGVLTIIPEYWHSRKLGSHKKHSPHLPTILQPNKKQTSTL